MGRLPAAILAALGWGCVCFGQLTVRTAPADGVSLEFAAWNPGNQKPVFGGSIRTSAGDETPFLFDDRLGVVVIDPEVAWDAAWLNSYDPALGFFAGGLRAPGQTDVVDAFVGQISPTLTSAIFGHFEAAVVKVDGRTMFGFGAGPPFFVGEASNSGFADVLAFFQDSDPNPPDIDPDIPQPPDEPRQDFGLTPIPFRDDDTATVLTTFAGDILGGYAERAGPPIGRLRPVCGTGTTDVAPLIAGVVATVDPAHQVCWGTAYDGAFGADAGDVIWIHPVTGGAGLIPSPSGESARGRVDSAFGGVVIYSGGSDERYIYRPFESASEPLRAFLSRHGIDYDGSGAARLTGDPLTGRAALVVEDSGAGRAVIVEGPLREFDGRSTGTRLAVFSGGLWFVDRNGDRVFDPSADLAGWGSPGDKPVSADWNGDGLDNLAVYSRGLWFIDYNGDGLFDPASELIGWGVDGWIPAPGDWNGDGAMNLGVVDPATMLWFRDLNGDGQFDAATEMAGWGAPGDTPIVGDWNGDGTDDLGSFSEGMWFLDLNGDGAFSPEAEIKGWGAPGWLALPGDWNGDGKTNLGVVSPESIWFRDRNGDFVFDPATEALGWGAPGDTPVSADWNGDGMDNVGVLKPNGVWHIDLNGDNEFQPDSESKVWGLPGSIPRPGRWR